MTDRKESIAVFKHECRNYIYYESRVKALQERIGLLDMRMQNVYSPVLDKIGSSPSRHELDYGLIIEQKDELNSLKAYYEKKIHWITDIIEGIPSPAYRLIIWLTYVDKENLQEIADEFNVSRQHIVKVRRAFLEKALTDEKMQELEDIENSREGGRDTRTDEQ